MSLWALEPADYRSRLSSLALVAVIAMVAGLAFWQGHAVGPRQAVGLQALISPSISILPTETEFPLPTPIEWEGYIDRMFVSGAGVEVVSRAAPGEAFQAYMTDGQISPVTSGPVAVQGLWRGWTCAYGGYGGHCVPEVDIQSISQRPIMRE